MNEPNERYQYSYSSKEQEEIRKIYSYCNKHLIKINTFRFTFNHKKAEPMLLDPAL